MNRRQWKGYCAARAAAGDPVRVIRGPDVAAILDEREREAVQNAERCPELYGDALVRIRRIRRDYHMAERERDERARAMLAANECAAAVKHAWRGPHRQRARA